MLYIYYCPKIRRLLPKNAKYVIYINIYNIFSNFYKNYKYASKVLRVKIKKFK